LRRTKVDLCDCEDRFFQSPAREPIGFGVQARIDIIVAPDLIRGQASSSLAEQQVSQAPCQARGDEVMDSRNGVASRTAAFFAAPSKADPHAPAFPTSRAADTVVVGSFPSFCPACEADCPPRREIRPASPVRPPLRNS